MSTSPSAAQARLTPDLDDAPPVVLFLIGMRVHSWWRIWSWLPVMLAMGRMLRELAQQPARGLRAVRFSSPSLTAQYWNSLDELLAYAADRDGEHAPAWAAFNRTLAKSGHVGIWHETYLVPASQIEAISVHMPPQGLFAYHPLVPATGHKKQARQRLRHAAADSHSPQRDDAM